MKFLKILSLIPSFVFLFLVCMAVINQDWDKATFLLLFFYGYYFVIIEPSK